VVAAANGEPAATNGRAPWLASMYLIRFLVVVASVLAVAACGSTATVGGGKLTS
jgi:hypothetical protein